MEKTLAVLNQMEADGIIQRYAIGGAIAAAYSYRIERGYQPSGEAINIEGWPVQFLPAFNLLIEEALTNAVEVAYGATTTRIFKD